MVKVAVAGASGQLAREIIDGLVKASKHEIIALVRKTSSSLPNLPGVQWSQTNYEDQSDLIRLLSGVHTVLCFFISHKDPHGVSQKRLIDAAVQAGVKRFAASEWSIGLKLNQLRDAVPWYSSKLDVRAYLEGINREEKVLEYTLFHPGLFMNYLGYPRQTTSHITLTPFMFDLNDMRAIVNRKYLNTKLTYTAIEDIVGVVARAVEYRDEWPKVGGIVGSQVTIGQLLGLGEKIRGKPFHIDWVDEQDLNAGILKASWLPPLDHQDTTSSPEEQESFRRTILIGLLTSVAHGAWEATNEWNQLLPDYEFTGLEQFLQQVWAEE